MIYTVYYIYGRFDPDIRHIIFNDVPDISLLRATIIFGSHATQN